MLAAAALPLFALAGIERLAADTQPAARIMGVAPYTMRRTVVVNAVTGDDEYILMKAVREAIDTYLGVAAARVPAHSR